MSNIPDHIQDAARNAFPDLLQRLTADLQIRNSGQSNTGGLCEAALSLEMASDALRILFRREAAKLRREHNALRPINQLPPEIITRIYFSVLDGDQYTEHYNKLSILSQVCLAWKTLVNGTPSLWNVVSFARTPEEIDEVLYKSSNVPLVVHYAGVDDGSYEHLLTRVLGQIHRIKKASFRLPASGGDATKKILETPAPLLEDIAIIWYRPGAFLPDFLGGHAPRLKYVTTWGFPLDLTSEVFKDLRCLCLRRVEEPVSGFSLAALLGVLASSPNLESIVLARLSLSSESFDCLLGSIYLPRLKRLEVDYLSVAASRALLTSIYAPQPLSLFKLRCSDSSTNSLARLINSSTPLIVESAKRFLSDTNACLKFRLHSEYLKVTSDVEGTEVHDERSYTLQLQCNDTLTCIHAFLDLMGGCPITCPITLELDLVDETDLLPTVRLLNRMPFITHLKFEPHVATKNVLGFLGRHQRREGVVQWPLPRLTALEVSEPGIPLDLILDMIRARHGDIAHTLEPPELAEVIRPIKLQDILLPGSRYGAPDTIRAIEELIGQGRLRWGRIR